MNIGERPILSEHGLVTTAAWRVRGKTVYALEGSAFIAGAAVQWLRDGLGIIASAKDIEALARKVASSDGVVFVPALAGLGAPHWDAGARGLITGITRGTTAAHLARATLEGIALEVRDLLEAMSKDTRAARGGAQKAVARLRVDGGAASNDLLMQLQADIADVIVERPADVESTGRGAAMLAAVGAGLVEAEAQLEPMLSIAARFEPKMDPGSRTEKLSRWADALRRTRTPPGG
jgi:glycerol kinase